MMDLPLRSLLSSDDAETNSIQGLADQYLHRDPLDVPVDISQSKSMPVEVRHHLRQADKLGFLFSQDIY